MLRASGIQSRCGLALLLILSVMTDAGRCQSGAMLGEPIFETGMPTPVADPNLPIANPNNPRPSLTLDDVLISVDRFYPLLLAKVQQRGIAGGELMSTLGGADLKWNMHERANQGSFDNNRFGFGFDQKILYNGMNLYGGYRKGDGSYPSYYGNRLTAEGGEIFVGARLPLLRDRSIDVLRAAIQKKEIGVSLAEPEIALARLQFERLAGRAYWSWLASAERYRIAAELLRIAEERDTYLQKRLKAGAISKIDVVDNQRTIVARRTRLASFRRGFEKASIQLSLYLRDPAANPVRPDVFWSAPLFPPPSPPNPQGLAPDIQIALSNRPELEAFRLRRQQLAVDADLTENQLLPNLDVVVQGAQDFGSGKKTLDRAAYEAGILFEVPLQRRFARGKLLALQAKLQRLNIQEQFQRDQISAEVQDAVSAMTRFFEMFRLAQESVRVNRQMEEAELRKFQLGKSNMIFVNLRELSRAEAQFQEVDALVQFYQAVSDYFAALGLNPKND